MNTITYEEDLQKNPLYLKLMERCSLLQEICLNNWLVALPRVSSFHEQSLSNHEFMLSHILSPSEELPRSHFINLIGEEVIINEQVIKFKEDTSHQCTILFEEFYYTRDMQKFKIICIDMPLSAKFIKKSRSPNSTVKNLQESAELLKASCSKQSERKIDNAIKNFSLRTQKSADYGQFCKNIKLLYDYCINVACNKRVKDDPFLAMNMKISVEYIIIEAVYEKLFDSITIQYSEDSQKFNKILRKLSNISLNDLNLSHMATSSKVMENLNILKIELLKIDNSKSSLDKLSCIKNVIDAISTLNDKKLTATDELLPILVYLIIKTNFFYWIPTLMFIKEFNLSQILNSEAHSVGSALLYILTTLEAIIYFIQTNENMHLDRNQLFKVTQSVDEVTTQEDYLNYLFTLVQDNNEAQLVQHLQIPFAQFIKEKSVSAEVAANSLSCHPLCACASCENRQGNSSSSNANQSAEGGLRMLHIASFYNVPKIVSLILADGVLVDAVDDKGFTALHYAAMRGHQKVLFLLMHSEANINLKTKEEQTALMLASLNGHEHCVKALLFFCEHTHISIDINAQDKEGMSALHYASQCGFDAIVETLLEYQAKATLKNHIGKTPLDYAYNSVIEKLLENAIKYQVEELPISESEFIFVRKQDLDEIFAEDK